MYPDYYNMYNQYYGTGEFNYRRNEPQMDSGDSYTLIMSIMTDELRHANKYNFLIHNAK